MSRRSPSPEGVGDLLKQDSFGAFEDEEENLDQGEAMDQDDDFTVNLDDQPSEVEMKEATPVVDANEGKASQSSGRQPIPHFPSRTGGNDPPPGASLAGNARYFIIKSNNHSNIEQSIKYGIWATQKHNEDKFVEAFKSGTTVYFVFSVNMSGHFQGYAKMIGLPFKHKQGLWGGGAAVSNSYDIEWIRCYDLAFRDLEHIRNPWNEDKPIKISRDGQELPPSLGRQVCMLFEKGSQAAGKAAPPTADRNHDFNVGPAVGGSSFFRGGAGGRGGLSGPRPPRDPPPMGNMMGGGMSSHGLPPGMVMTPMGPVPTHVAMQMGMGGGMMGGMDFNPHMMGMNPMMDMGAMQAMMSGRGMPNMMGMAGGMPPGPRGPVPPPKPPPPKSPPRERERDVMELMMKNALRNMSTSGRDSVSREEEVLLRALEMSRGRGSPSRDRRRYRSRSRSPSPRRHRSHRRSRSRSRSRSGGRRERMADMSYDDYIDAYNALKRARKEDTLDFAGGMQGSAKPAIAQMASLMGSTAPKAQWPSAANGSVRPAAMNGGSAGDSSVGNMTEDEYVRVWEEYSNKMGTAFDANTVRGWYRQHKQMNARK